MSEIKACTQSESFEKKSFVAESSFNPDKRINSENNMDKIKSNIAESYNPDKRIEMNHQNIEKFGIYKPDKRIEQLSESKILQNELTESYKNEICKETGWSKEVIDMMNSKEEIEIYKKAGLQEFEIDGKKFLIRSDIDMMKKDEFGRTNKERMENGNPPLIKNGESVELHHVGQKSNSPLAELTKWEHRGRGNDIILHDKQKESEINRNEFKKEREQYWKIRAKLV